MKKSDIKKLPFLRLLGTILFFLSMLNLLNSCSLLDRAKRRILGTDKPEKTEVSRNATQNVAKQNSERADLQNSAPLSLAGDDNTVPLNNAPSLAPDLASNQSNWVVDSNLAETSEQQELQQLQTALGAYLKQQWDSALGLLRPLLNAKNDQVRVRANYYTGKIWQSSQKLDLALQQFEKIIENQAYSSLALLALKDASDCAQQLGNKDRFMMYQTLLQDFSSKL